MVYFYSVIFVLALYNTTKATIFFTEIIVLKIFHSVISFIFSLRTISKNISLSFKIIYCPNWPNYLVLNRCMISQSITLYQSWQETDGVNQLGYLRTVQYIKVKDLFNQKDYCSSLWLITTKFDNFYEVKRKKKKKNTKKLFLNLEVRVEWWESLVDKHCSIENQ